MNTAIGYLLVVVSHGKLRESLNDLTEYGVRGIIQKLGTAAAHG